MSLELRDLRVKVKPETDVTIEAYARSHGCDKAEAVRSVLEEWAHKQIQDAMLLVQALKREGLNGERRGKAGTNPNQGELGD